MVGGPPVGHVQAHGRCQRGPARRVRAALRGRLAAVPASAGSHEVIEAELKAHVRNPQALHQQLSRLATGQQSVYHDTYYDRPGKDLTGSGRELRLRTVQADGLQRSLLTYKEPAVDAASGSKPEYETEVASPDAVDVLLRGIGLEHLVS